MVGLLDKAKKQESGQSEADAVNAAGNITGSATAEHVTQNMNLVLEKNMEESPEIKPEIITKTPADSESAGASDMLAESMGADQSTQDRVQDRVQDLVQKGDISQDVSKSGGGEQNKGDGQNKVVKSKLALGEIMVMNGLISEDQLQIALKIQEQQDKANRAMLGSILVDLGFITESALGEVLAESTGIDKIDIKSSVLDPNLVKQIPKHVAERYKLIPISMSEDVVNVAISDVYNVLAIDQVQRYFPRNYKVSPVYCPEGEILDLIDHYYDYEMSVDGILKEIETGIREKVAKLSGEAEGYVNPTVRLVDSILVDAIKKGASDIHFEPEGSFLRLRYRIDGRMMQVRSFHRDYWSAIAVRIKIISGMNIAETRNPQDGRIAYNLFGREVDFRVSSQPTVYGENIVMRILDKKKGLLSLTDLGCNERNLKLLKKLLKRPEGIVIVTGPTGAGKTTTLYSILNYINSVDVNIMTLEDPIEYQIPMLRQSNVKEGTGMNFNDGIRSIMRQDPDIILIGEVRDEDTANMAIRAAMTGHQVFTTLHTNDAIGAIPRLVDIGLKPSLIAGSLICTTAQRLARKLCLSCRKEKIATKEECKILGVDANNPPEIYEHAGCEKCFHTGYKGRVSVVEILPIDREFDELIASGATRKAMRDYALSKGFMPMIEDGVQKVLDGLTDIEELIETIDMTERM